MLKRIVSLALCVLPAVSLSGCVKKVSDVALWGLVPGTYYFQSVEGDLPEGWAFDSSSSFKHRILGEHEDYDDDIWLEDGQWDMQSFSVSKDGSRFVKERNHNAAMIWSNTPFDTMSSLRMGCRFATEANVAIMGGIYDRSSEKACADWEHWNVDCMIEPIENGDFDKRKVTVELTPLPYDTNDEKILLVFSV